MTMANFVTAAASSFSASTSASGRSHYDVFISHREADVKNTFASHLYRRLRDCGLRAFLDQDELKKGYNFPSQRELAIRGAKVQIAILSPAYAESRWYLDELVLMKNSGATILPIFFKVDPSEVRDTLKGVYAKFLRELEKTTTSDPQTPEKKPRYAPETIQNWRDALSYVANLSGFVHRDQDDEGELSENVVEGVLKELLKTPLDVAKYPAGLDNKLEDLKKTVLYQQQQQQESERLETKVIGIVGIGGVGKTTLAKSFFNSQRSSFKESSFLSEVRESAARMSLNSLQSKLIKDLLHTDEITVDSHNGIELFQRHLKSCHAMIVLDDIDHISQLQAFLPLKNILSPGSLILVTSRDKHVLVSSGVSEQSIYHLKGLDRPNSQELFCFHAFHKPLPPPEFADLVDLFVKACDGLPLFLKVFGAHVCGLNERSLWEEILDELVKTLATEIYDTLKISYDSLEPGVKEIFLDIACFFLGEDGDKAMGIWGKVGIRNLQLRCLVELDGQNKIQMHDHIRNMGRKIAEEVSRPLRLWHCSTASIEDLLVQRTSVINEVRGIKMDIPKELRREMGHLSFAEGLQMRLRHLRLLAVTEGYLEDILRRVQLPHLIWLRWYGCNYSSLPDWIPMENLRVLEVEGSTLNTLWAHQSQAVPFQLRELNINAPLSEIPKSIGQLKLLERIVIRCPSPKSTLESLPDEFCNLLSLKYLVFDEFSGMLLLPDRFGELTNLQHIDLDGAASLQMLPNSFGNLEQLKHISLNGASSLQRLPYSFGNLANLERLDIGGCEKLQFIPGLRQLTKLTHLDVHGCGEIRELDVHGCCEIRELDVHGCREIRELTGVEHLTSLERLDIGGCDRLQFIPGLGQFTKLTHLNVHGCREKRELPGMEHLTSLEWLDVGECEKLQSIPELGQLSNLTHLDIHRCRKIRELPGVEHLTSLEWLDVGKCEKLQSIPGLGQLTNLTHLDVHGCCEIRELPGVEHLTSLEWLDVGKCEKLQSIPGLGQLTNLTHLDVHGCCEIRELPGVEHLTSLELLDVGECQKLQSIPGLGQLTNLTHLNVHGYREIRELDVHGCREIRELDVHGCCEIRKLDVHGCREIRELTGVEHLTSLERLDIGGCDRLQFIPGLGQFTKLTHLNVHGCREKRELPGMEHLTSLEWLDVGECEKLQSIPELGQLSNLTHLDIHRCREIRELPGVEHLTSLEWLDVGKCEKLQSIPGLGQLTKLTHLDVHGCCEIRELPGVEHLTSLEWLDVGKCEKLQSIPGLGQLTNLTHLDVHGCREIRELPGVEHLTSLELLDVGECQKLQSIPWLGQFTELTHLYITELTHLNIKGCSEILELPGEEHMTSLERLDIGGCEKLIHLDVHGCREIRELPGVEHLTSLEKLDVGGCEKLQFIRGSGQLTKLTHLDVHGCREIQELDVHGCREIRELLGVEHLTSLERLNIRGCEKLQFIPGLGQFTKLTHLDVHGCREIRELPGVEHLTSLEYLNVGGCKKLQSIPGLVQLVQIRQLNERHRKRCSCM